MKSFLAILIALGIAAGQARALVSMAPELAAELKAKGAYDAVMRQLDDARARGVFRMDHTRSPMQGVGKKAAWRALVILVDFPDFPATGNYNQTEFDDLLFSEGTYPTGSMRDFYLENSYGDFSFSGDVVGWYTMPQNYSYYCNNDGVPSGDDFGFGDYPNNAQKLFEDAIAAADPFVNFGLYRNGGASVDGIFVVHAGPGAEATGNPNHIWSHRSSYTVGTSDGVNCTSYTFQPELLGASISTMGVFGHEFGHSLGLPDLYDTDYSSAGIGRWSMMAGGSWNGGGATPAHFDAWCKIELGFTVPTDITVQTDAVVIPPSYANEAAVRIKTPAHGASESIILENRRKQGFDASLPSQGLLVWHVDGSQGSNSFESCGANPVHPIVRLIQADGLCDLENDLDSGDAGDPFPGSTNNTTLGALTSPNSRAYSGKKSGVRLDNVALVGVDVVVDIDPAEVLVFEVPTQYPTLASALTLAGFDDDIRLRSDHVVSGNHTITAPVKISGGWDAGFTTQDPQNKSMFQGTGSLQPLLRVVANANGTPILSNLQFSGGRGYYVTVPSGAYLGGAVYMQGGTLTIEECVFANNDAGPNNSEGSHGGAIALVGVTATITGSQFSGNEAKSGGDLYVEGGSVVVDDCQFQGGTLFVPPVADEQHGGSIELRAGGVLQMNDCTLAGYSGADQGGAIHVDGASLELSGTAIDGCDAEAKGGGIYANAGSTLLWTDSQLGNCSNGDLGAGIYAENALVQIDGGTLHDNSTTSLGGGLYLLNPLAASRLRSLLIEANQAAIVGGGLIVSGGEILVEHCVFHANVSTLGTAGAAQILNSNTTFRSNIVHDSVGGGVYWSGGGSNDHNCFWGTSPGADLIGATPGIGTRWEDPLFVDDASGDFHLGASSPLIDIGSNQGALDFDGSAPDMGLYGGAHDDGDRPAAPGNFAVDTQIDGDHLSWEFSAIGTPPASTRIFQVPIVSLPKDPLYGDSVLADVPAPSTSWLDESAVYAFQIQLVDANGRGGSYSPEAQGDNPDPAPERRVFAVGQPAPNPFNPSTTLRFELPRKVHVRALLFDARGRQLRALADREFDAGPHELRWDGRDASGAPAASGLYFLRLTSAAGDATRRLILLK